MSAPRAALLALLVCGAACAPTEYPPTAKNVILFIGDGMGVSTITAARIFDGQSKGMQGEENELSFERFPFALQVHSGHGITRATFQRRAAL